MFKRFAMVGIRVSLTSLLLAAVTLSPAKVEAGTLPGGWACLWHLTVEISGSIFNVNQLLRLAVTSTGAVSGNLFHSFPNNSTLGGEVCDLAVSSGNLTVGTNGVGTLTATISVPTGATDEDNDVGCNQVFTNGTTESFRFVTAHSNTELLFIGRDPFFTNASGDNGDFASISGTCEQQ